jgi:hypothetical protein
MTEGNLKRKPRAKVMLEGIRRLITLRATSSNEKREKLAQEILAEIEERYPKETPPTEETIIKMISRARNHKPSPLDKPWHLGVLNDLQSLGIPDISAEAVKRIQEIQFFVSSNNLIPLTIRQAKWISKLHRLITDNTIYNYSHLYSSYELVCSVSDTPFDTTKIDVLIGDWDKFSSFVQHFYSDLPDKIIEAIIILTNWGEQEEQNDARNNNQALKR